MKRGLMSTVWTEGIWGPSVNLRIVRVIAKRAEIQQGVQSIDKHAVEL